MADESSIGVTNQSTASTEPVRTLTVTIWENGAPLTVDMQVVCLSDTAGNLISIGDVFAELKREARMQTAALQLLVSTILDRDVTRDDLALLAAGDET
jgi:hypothetical protein